MTMTAVVFDVDGVLTDTASSHFRAWRALFAETLPAGIEPFSRLDYDRLVDGRPRSDGLRATLENRGLLATTTERELLRLARRKQELFLEAIADGAEAFADAGPCLSELESLGLALAAASSSRNARAVLASCGLLDHFDGVVDGAEADRLGLPGKPAPDLFLHAAGLLGAEPRQCALVEDSIAGLVAGAAGGFGLVVGVDRSPHRSRGLDARADLVIATLTDLDPARLRSRRSDG